MQKYMQGKNPVRIFSSEEEFRQWEEQSKHEDMMCRITAAILSAACIVISLLSSIRH